MSAATTVLPGIDVLLADSLSMLDGMRVGLITNHTGLTAAGRPTIDALLAARGVRLVALYSPEHGIRGMAAPGESIASSRDERTGLPIHSLYGETRRPTAAMLDSIDVLLFDIQDIGARYYTYVWTMVLAMEAAAESNLRFVVLDRPNPIGGEMVNGNVLDSAFASFVGLHPVPMRHGMTAGELALMLNFESGIGADLTVIPARSWRRSDWSDATGLAWVPPSPNMPSLESAAHYPGTCLFEGTSLSVGRGTDRAFQQVGAPWLDAETVVQRLEARSIPGVRFDTVRFTPRAPADGKHDGVELNGIRFTVTDRAAYDPTHAALAALLEIRALHPGQLEFRAEAFDRLAGTSRLRAAILADATFESIAAEWEIQLDAFRARREPWLLYH